MKKPTKKGRIRLRTETLDLVGKEYVCIVDVLCDDGTIVDIVNCSSAQVRMGHKGANALINVIHPPLDITPGDATLVPRQ